MKYFKKLVGEKVYLSPINIDDAEVYVKWLNDKSVTDNIGGTSKVYNLINEKEWITKNTMVDRQVFCVVRLLDDKLLGSCSYNELDLIRGTGTVGLFIGENEERNKGYGTEALKLLVEYGFNYLNLHNIMLSVFAFNKQAIRTYEKVGFKKIGTRREAYYVNGKREDEIFMEILRSEYFD